MSRPLPYSQAGQWAVIIHNPHLAAIPYVILTFDTVIDGESIHATMPNPPADILHIKHGAQVTVGGLLHAPPKPGEQRLFTVSRIEILNS